MALYWVVGHGSENERDRIHSVSSGSSVYSVEDFNLRSGLAVVGI